MEIPILSSYQMKIDNSDHLPRVTLYALQTCGHCREAKIFLQQHQIAFRTVYMDLLVGEKHQNAEQKDTSSLIHGMPPVVIYSLLGLVPAPEHGYTVILAKSG